MKKFKGTVLVLVLLASVLVAFPGWAKVDQAAVGRGASELGLAFSWMQQHYTVETGGFKGGFNTSTYSGQFNYGYFLTKWLEIGPEYDVSADWVKWTGDFKFLGTSWIIRQLLEARATANLNLKALPTLIPYVAVKGGWFDYHETTMKAGGQGGAFGVAAGLRYFVSRQGALKLEWDYDKIWPSKLKYQGFGIQLKNSENVSVFLGTSIFIGGKK